MTKTDIAVLVVRIATLLITCFLAPAFKAWLETATENAREKRVKEWARMAVSAAEQAYKDYKKSDPDGTERHKHARRIIVSLAKRCGVALTEEEIDALIHAAVQQLTAEGITFEFIDDGKPAEEEPAE